MSTEAELREELATLTRILAMRGLLELHGHVSVYDPDAGRIYMCPGMGWDKANTGPYDHFVFDPQGNIVEGQGRRPPLEWPIHTAIHAARPDARAVAHLHSPWATLFAVAHREFRPVLIPGSMFADGVPLYAERRLITTTERGRRLVAVLGQRPAALLRGHGVVVAAENIPELLYAAIMLEDNARAAVQAAALGDPDFIDAEECAAIEADGAPFAIRARLAWSYFAHLEARWDRQGPVGAGPLA